MNKHYDMEVVTHIHFSRILVLGFVLLGIMLGVIVVLNQRDLRGKAQAPEDFNLVLPPTQELAPPYLRLAVSKKSYTLREKIPVGVYIHTGGIPVMEVRVIVAYDPEVLDLTVDQIRLESVFKTIQIESIERGKITFVVFINPTSDQQPIVSDNEMRIASLAFGPREATDTTQLTIELNDNSSSEIVEYSTTRIEKVTNLLKSAAGIEIQIKP